MYLSTKTKLKRPYKLSSVAAFVSFVCMLTMQSQANAQSTSVNPRLIYSINSLVGPSTLPNQPTTIVTFPILDANVKWDIFGECGQFDPNISIQGVFNGITEGFRDYMDGMIASATAAVAGLPGLILKRVDPGLYDIVEEGMLSASLDFEAAKMNCQQMQDWLFRDGESPWQDMKLMGDVAGWNFEMGIPGYGGPPSGGGATPTAALPSGNTNLIQVEEKMERADTGDQGYQWVCGAKRGGLGQTPIRSVRDLITVGYNTLIERDDRCSTSSAPAGTSSYQIVVYWPAPDDAAEFVIGVIGEEEIRTCQNCRKSTKTAGKGIMSGLLPIQLGIRTLMTDMVNEVEPISKDNLNGVSAAPSVIVTEELIYQLRKYTPGTAEQLIEKISDEIAYARLMEQTTLSVLLLRTGLTDPSVAEVPSIVSIIDDMIHRLTEERQLLIQDITENKRISSKTLTNLIFHVENENQNAKPYIIDKGLQINSQGTKN